MGCFSSKPTPPDPLPLTRTVIEPQPVLPPPGPSHQGLNTTPAPADLVQPDQPTPAHISPQPDGTPFLKPLPGSGRPSHTTVPRKAVRATSASPYHAGLGGWPDPEGETSRKPFLELDGPNPSSSAPHISRSFSDSPRNNAKNAARFQPLAVAPSSVTVPEPGEGARALCPTVQEVLPHDFRFRILVLGKRQSGKSSLISAVFNVDRAAAPGSQHGKADINDSFYLDNNRYLVVHEYLGFESGDAENLQTIRDFVSSRTAANCSASKRLHAIWVCVPISDRIERGLVEGVKTVLGMKKVPVLIVFTKHDDPRARAREMYEDLCRSHFHKGPKDVPAVIFSEQREYRDLIVELTSTAHRSIKTDSLKSTGRHTSTSSQPQVPPVAPAPLAWAVAQRANHDIIIRASIEVGRSRYWCNLGSSRNFSNHTLESCVNVIHEDIVRVWNFDDRESYLSGGEFTATMTGLVRNMAPPDVSGLYQSNDNRTVRYIMAYIVDLTVILHGLFLSTRRVSATNVHSAVKDYAESGSKKQIHEDIRSFVTVAPRVAQGTYQDKDIMLEKIIDLITQNCIPNQRRQ